MTLKLVVECDGRSCGAEIEIDPDGDTESNILSERWSIDDFYNGHYCSDCTRKIAAEN